MAGVGTPRRLSYSAIAAGIGGIVLIISLFLDWVSSDGFGANAWKIFSITDIFLFLLGLVAIAFALLELTGTVVNLPFRRDRALTIIGIITTTLTLDFLIEGSNQAIGLILATLASIAILAGGILAERRPELGVALGGGQGAPTQQMPRARGRAGRPTPAEPPAGRRVRAAPPGAAAPAAAPGRAPPRRWRGRDHGR